MNAIAANFAGNRWNRTFGWLLRREFWENRGGFLWAPVITGGIAVVMASLLAIATAIQSRSEANEAVTNMAAYLGAVGATADGLLMTGCSMTGTVLGFVVFFYALGSLYDDRRDRSALFWKSLPVSDTQTVLSKAAWALLLAPLMSLAIGLVVGVILWLVAAVTMLAGNLPGTSALFTHSHPFTVAGHMLATVPLDMLWMLPAVGWLMFCSALVRSKPFLWAVVVPVLGCVMISILGFTAGRVVPSLELPLGAIWYAAVYRGLVSVMPGTRALRDIENLQNINVDDPSQVIVRLLNEASNWHVLGTWDLWIGVAVGVGLIAAAIPLRRWRDEA